MAANQSSSQNQQLSSSTNPPSSEDTNQHPGFITNPSVVKVALKKKSNNNNNNNNNNAPRQKNGKNKSKNDASEQKKKEPKPKEPKKSKSDVAKVDNKSTDSPKKSKAAASNAEEDLKKALFPDLFSSAAPKKQQQPNPSKKAGKSGPRAVLNGTGSKSPVTATGVIANTMKDGSAVPTVFAGSSFHSSPAASSLPRPSFKAKGPEEVVAASTSAPSSSIFDQFMQADKQERENPSVKYHTYGPNATDNSFKSTSPSSSADSSSPPPPPAAAAASVLPPSTVIPSSFTHHPSMLPPYVGVPPNMHPPSIPGLSIPHFPQPHLMPHGVSPFNHTPANVVFQNHPPMPDPQHLSHLNIAGLHIDPNPFNPHAADSVRHQYPNGVGLYPTPAQSVYSPPPGFQPMPVHVTDKRQ